jgi:hypothetical protein
VFIKWRPLQVTRDMRLLPTPVLAALCFCGGCDWPNQEQPAVDLEDHTAVVYGVVTDALGRPIPEVALVINADERGRCPAGEALSTTSILSQPKTDARGAYRTEVAIEETVTSSCVRVRAYTSSTLRASVSAGPVRFGRTPPDSLQINLTLGP